MFSFKTPQDEQILGQEYRKTETDHLYLATSRVPYQLPRSVFWQSVCFCLGRKAQSIYFLAWDFFLLHCRVAEINPFPQSSAIECYLPAYRWSMGRRSRQCIMGADNPWCWSGWRRNAGASRSAWCYWSVSQHDLLHLSHCAPSPSLRLIDAFSSLIILLSARTFFRWKHAEEWRSHLAFLADFVWRGKCDSRAMPLR